MDRRRKPYYYLSQADVEPEVEVADGTWEGTELDVAKFLISILCRQTGGRQTLKNLLARKYKPFTQFHINTKDNLKEFLERYPQSFVLKGGKDDDSNDNEEVVEVTSNIAICPLHVRRYGSCPEDGECGKLHVCKYFMLTDDCEFNPFNCHYGHKVRTDHNVTVLKGLLMDHLTTTDVRTLMKRRGTRTAATRPQICKFYNNINGCFKVPKCFALHLCKRYILGECTFGDKCMRSHDLFDPSVTAILNQYGVDVEDISELMWDNEKDVVKNPIQSISKLPNKPVIPHESSQKNSTTQKKTIFSLRRGHTVAEKKLVSLATETEEGCYVGATMHLNPFSYVNTQPTGLTSKQPTSDNHSATSTSSTDIRGSASYSDASVFCESNYTAYMSSSESTISMGELGSWRVPPLLNQETMELEARRTSDEKLANVAPDPRLYLPSPTWGQGVYRPVASVPPQVQTKQEFYHYEVRTDHYGAKITEQGVLQGPATQANVSLGATVNNAILDQKKKEEVKVQTEKQNDKSGRPTGNQQTMTQQTNLNKAAPSTSFSEQSTSACMAEAESTSTDVIDAKDSLKNIISNLISDMHKLHSTNLSGPESHFVSYLSALAEPDTLEDELQAVVDEAEEEEDDSTDDEVVRKSPENVKYLSEEEEKQKVTAEEEKKSPVNTRYLSEGEITDSDDNDVISTGQGKNPSPIVISSSSTLAPIVISSSTSLVAEKGAAMNSLSEEKVVFDYHHKKSSSTCSLAKVPGLPPETFMPEPSRRPRYGDVGKDVSGNDSYGREYEKRRSRKRSRSGRARTSDERKHRKRESVAVEMEDIESSEDDSLSDISLEDDTNPDNTDNWLEEILSSDEAVVADTSQRLKKDMSTHNLASVQASHHSFSQGETHLSSSDPNLSKRQKFASSSNHSQTKHQVRDSMSGRSLNRELLHTSSSRQNLRNQNSIDEKLTTSTSKTAAQAQIVAPALNALLQEINSADDSSKPMKRGLQLEGISPVALSDKSVLRRLTPECKTRMSPPRLVFELKRSSPKRNYVTEAEECKDQAKDSRGPVTHSSRMSGKSHGSNPRQRRSVSPAWKSSTNQVRHRDSFRRGIPRRQSLPDKRKDNRVGREGRPSRPDSRHPISERSGSRLSDNSRPADTSQTPGPERSRLTERSRQCDRARHEESSSGSERLKPNKRIERSILDERPYRSSRDERSSGSQSGSQSRLDHGRLENRFSESRPEDRTRLDDDRPRERTRIDDRQSRNIFQCNKGRRESPRGSPEHEGHDFRERPSERIVERSNRNEFPHERNMRVFRERNIIDERLRREDLRPQEREKVGARAVESEFHQEIHTVDMPDARDRHEIQYRASSPHLNRRSPFRCSPGRRRTMTPSRHQRCSPARGHGSWDEHSSDERQSRSPVRQSHFHYMCSETAETMIRESRDRGCTPERVGQEIRDLGFRSGSRERLLRDSSAEQHAFEEERFRKEQGRAAFHSPEVSFECMRPEGPVLELDSLQRETYFDPDMPPASASWHREPSVSRSCSIRNRLGPSPVHFEVCDDQEHFKERGPGSFRGGDPGFDQNEFSGQLDLAEPNRYKRFSSYNEWKKNEELKRTIKHEEKAFSDHEVLLKYGSSSLSEEEGLAERRFNSPFKVVPEEIQIHLREPHSHFSCDNILPVNNRPLTPDRGFEEKRQFTPERPSGRDRPARPFGRGLRFRGRGWRGRGRDHRINLHKVPSCLEANRPVLDAMSLSESIDDMLEKARRGDKRTAPDHLEKKPRLSPTHLRPSKERGMASSLREERNDIETRPTQRRQPSPSGKSGKDKSRDSSRRGNRSCDRETKDYGRSERKSRTDSLDRERGADTLEEEGESVDARERIKNRRLSKGRRPIRERLGFVRDIEYSDEPQSPSRDQGEDEEYPEPPPWETDAEEGEGEFDDTLEGSQPTFWNCEEGGVVAEVTDTSFRGGYRGRSRSRRPYRGRGWGQARGVWRGRARGDWHGHGRGGNGDADLRSLLKNRIRSKTLQKAKVEGLQIRLNRRTSKPCEKGKYEDASGREVKINVEDY